MPTDRVKDEAEPEPARRPRDLAAELDAVKAAIATIGVFLEGSDGIGSTEKRALRHALEVMFGTRGAGDG